MKRLLLVFAALSGLLAAGCPDTSSPSPGGSIAVRFDNLTADGSPSATTGKLTLTFDKDITGLAASDITLTPGITGALKGSLTKAARTGVYELEVNGINDSGNVRVDVAKSGYTISGSPQQIEVYYSSGAPPVSVVFSSVNANGSATETTSKLTLTFDTDISGLLAGNITLGGTTGATAVSLTKTGGTGVYELEVTNITQSGTVTVSVSKSGYDISGNHQTVSVVYYKSGGGNIAAAFTNVSANGSPTETTSKLTLTFDKDISGLVASDIVLTAGSTGAVNGTLTKAAGTGIYELTVTGITQGGTVTVSVSKAGYTISGSSKTVTVSYSTPGTAGITITFTQISDAAPELTVPTLYRVSHSGPTTAILTVDDSSQYSSINWQVDNTAGTTSGPSFILSAAKYAIADHFVTVMVIKDGVPYNKTVSFKIEY